MQVLGSEERLRKGQLYIEMTLRWRKSQDTQCAARDRLKSALVSDRQTVAPQLMNCLQRDIEECMSRYLRADKEASVYKMVDRDGKMTLQVEVPVIHILRQGSMPQEAMKDSAEEESIELKLPNRKLRKARSRRFRSSESE